ncbi:hypothetical protein N7G274_007194 [Stereocaulon virgatum]|uniref:Uncharacterized protein n=1 Tax=Stereocaulon virgatum TaxID=373712 RepID=A0ABR4A5T6_9LECA
MPKPCCKLRGVPKSSLPRALMFCSRLPPSKPSQIQSTLVDNLPPAFLPLPEVSHRPLFEHRHLNNLQGLDRKIVGQPKTPVCKRALWERPIKIRLQQWLGRAIRIMWSPTIPFKRDRVVRRIVQIPEVVVDEAVVHPEDVIKDVFAMFEELGGRGDGRGTAEMRYPRELVWAF